MAAEFKPVSYRQATLHGPYDAIVIGSGAGGLAAAVLLSKHAGKRRSMQEKSCPRAHQATMDDLNSGGA